MKAGDLVKHEVFENQGFGIVVEVGHKHVNVLWAGYSKQTTEAFSLVRLASESR